MKVICKIFLFMLIKTISDIKCLELPGSCKPGQYYDPGLLTCQTCPANSSMITSPDGFACSCAEHSIPAGIAHCKPCNATELVSSDGTSCVPRRCQNSSGRFVCRKCPNDYISVTQNFDGSSLKEVLCVKCARGYKVSVNACVRCESCACPRNHIIVKGICIPKTYVSSRPKSEDNRLHPSALLDVVKQEYLCTKNDLRACRTLASECVRDLYSIDPAGPCRLWIQSKSIIPKGLPPLLVESSSNDRTPAEIVLPHGKDNLLLAAALFTSNGGLKLLQDTSQRNSLCQLPIRIKIGNDISHDCEVNISELNTFDHNATLAPYLQMDGDFKQIPVALRTPDGYYVQRGTWPTNKFRRFFMMTKRLSTIANVTNVVYLRTLLVRIRIERDTSNSGTLLVHISIETQYATKSTIASSVSMSLRVKHEMPNAGVVRGLEIWGGVLGSLLALYAMVQWRGNLRRGGYYITIMPFLSGSVSDALYFAAWFSTLHALAAEAGTLGLTLRLSQSENKIIKAFIYSAVSLKAIKVAWLNWNQCRCDVFFLDWTEYNSPMQDSLKPNTWRAASLAREWSILQTNRRVSPGITITFALLILKLMAPWQSYLPQSVGYKWAVVGIAWWSSYTTLLTVRWILDRLLGPPPACLPRVCTGVGLSLLVFQEEYYAHYVHGRNDDPKDVRSMVSPLATCRVVCAPQLRAVYKQLSIDGPAGLGETESRQALLSRFLAAFFERALDGLSWVASERTVLERLLDVELTVREAGNTSTLLYDPDNITPSCVAVTWWGEEWSLATFDNMLFSCVFISLDDSFVAALVTIIVWQIMKHARMWFGNRNQNKTQSEFQSTLFE